jgi:predicted nucleotidyltransferase
MNVLTDTQRADVRDLLAACDAFHAEVVVIGATAYRLLMDDADRHTLDIDLALALDLGDFSALETALVDRGWTRSDRLEHRWTTPQGNRFDLLPAGPELRRRRQITWPKSGFVMRLDGFEHVFNRAVLQDVGDGLTLKVVPPAVLALLKMAAYVENPTLRAKDLDDIKRLLRWYETSSPRLFSDAVLKAELPDFEFANAFLLGVDLQAIADDSERAIVDRFLERARQTIAGVDEDDEWLGPNAARFRQQLQAFEEAFAAHS